MTARVQRSIGVPSFRRTRPGPDSTRGEVACSGHRPSCPTQPAWRLDSRDSHAATPRHPDRPSPRRAPQRRRRPGRADPERRPARRLRRRLHPTRAAARPAGSGDRPHRGHDRHRRRQPPARSCGGSPSRSTATASSSPAASPSARPACSSRPRTQAALARCRPALVGRGSFGADVDFPTLSLIPVRGRLLAFNGRDDGRPAILLHLYVSSPVQVTFVLPFKATTGQGGGTSAPCSRRASRSSPATSATSPTST